MMSKKLTDLENKTILNKVPARGIFTEWEKVGIRKMRLSMLRIKKEFENKGEPDIFFPMMINTKWWDKFSRKKGLLDKLNKLVEEEKKLKEVI
jgi:hypothetical protein